MYCLGLGLVQDCASCGVIAQEGLSPVCNCTFGCGLMHNVELYVMRGCAFCGIVTSPPSVPYIRQRFLWDFA